MLDNLMNLVKQYAGEEVNNNPAIPADKKGPIVEETGRSITGSLQNLASGGGLNDLLGMFKQGGGAPAPGSVTQSLSGDMISNLTKKFGLDQQTAGGIAGGIIPKVLGGLVNKTNDPNDKGFDLQSIFNSLTGGKTGGMDLQGMLGKFKGGLDKDKDGDVDMKDIMGMFK